MAFHRGMGSALALPMTGVEIPLPDKGFLLTCDEYERQDRLKRRPTSNSAKWRSLAECSKEKIAGEYQRFNLEPVDTTGLKIEQVVGLLYDRITS